MKRKLVAWDWSENVHYSPPGLLWPFDVEECHVHEFEFEQPWQHPTG
jgi:hypothetical protein